MIIITKQQFKQYVNIQKSGVTNMWDIDLVIQLSNNLLTQEDCFYIMKHYSELETGFLK